MNVARNKELNELVNKIIHYKQKQILVIYSSFNLIYPPEYIRQYNNPKE